MSRLWSRPRICLYVSDRQIVICRVTGRWRPLLLQKEVLDFADGQLAPVLEAWWRSRAEPADIEIVLGSAQVRYLMLPWDPQLAREALRKSVAATLFTRQFQEDATRYRQRFAAAGYGKPRLVAFVSDELVTALERVFSTKGARVRHIEPLLLSVWTRFAARLKKGARTLWLLEENRLLRVDSEDGVMLAVQLRPCTEEILLQQMQKTDAAGSCVFAPLLPAVASRYPDAWLGLPERPDFQAGRDACYAYALCGVL